MAYLLALPHAICQGCRIRGAQVTLFTAANKPAAVYCTRCGKRELELLQAREAEYETEKESR